MDEGIPDDIEPWGGYKYPLDKETIEYLKQSIAEEERRDQIWCLEYRLKRIKEDIERADQYVGSRVQT